MWIHGCTDTVTNTNANYKYTLVNMLAATLYAVSCLHDWRITLETLIGRSFGGVVLLLSVLLILKYEKQQKLL